MVKRNFKLSADISTDAKDKLLAICDKSDRSRGQILERMINKFHAETFKGEKPKAAVTPRFQKPTYVQVYNYMRDRGFNSEVEAQSFIDHFTSNGWKVGGRAAMKDWKAAVRNWLKGKGNETNKPANIKSGRKLNAVEEANKRLLEKYGNNATHDERTINQPIDTRLDQHQVCGGVSAQVDSSGVTLDMDSGNFDYDGSADS